jgi:RNA polymerase sigma factor (sigma-70 family)
MTSASLAFLRTQSDDRLVALARGGHERAFEAMVERHRRALLSHARRLLPEARAEDALQQALLAAWTALQRGDDVRDLRAWLHRILHNTALNALRVSGYDHEDLREALSLADAPQEELERRMVMRRTLAGVAALPDRQREALLRTAVEGRSQDEVAAALGLSQGALRQLVHRARTTLRAAATALTPLPLATWLATAGERAEPLAGRISELAAGAGSAGAGATLAKVGVVGVLAAGGAAIGGPAVVERSHPPVRAGAREASVVTSAHRRHRVSPVAAPVAAVPIVARSRTIAAAVVHERRRSLASHTRRGGRRDPSPAAATRASRGERDDEGRGSDERGEAQGGRGDGDRAQAPSPPPAATPEPDDREHGGADDESHRGDHDGAKSDGRH